VALPALEAVAGVATELAVMSQPDKPVGRKKVLTPTAVGSWAIDRGVTLFRPENHEAIAQAVSDFAPDVGITVAYGRLLRPEVLTIPPFGWWNLHFSLLPRWRGAAPVQHALLAGDATTGVTVFQLDEGMDTGPVLSQRSHPITPGITAGELLEELSRVGASVLIDTLHTHQRGELTPTPQRGNPTAAPKLDRDTGHIRPPHTIDEAFRRFQATTPEPGCFVSWDGGKHTLRVWQARALNDASLPADGRIQATSEGVGVRLTGGILLFDTVQPAGKKSMPAGDWWRGVHREIVVDG
jgi:methionyl-tRNA formyltransferase